MSTHKYIDRICAGIAAFTLLLTILFMNGTAFGIQPAARVIGYENRLFDISRVHTIDIVMNNWEEFIAGCENEEYATCAAVIDGETYRNIAIRAKGNTSLSNVASMGSQRYSFKIEFDHYDKTGSYHGLDKISLNNLIQDYTMMKDYLTYQLMGAFDVAAPLCSFAYLTVNGEDWGLYLAVESIEESFLLRNYGRDYGYLYKPDSMQIGGGRGNGQNFRMSKFWENQDENAGQTNTNTEQGTGWPFSPGNFSPEDFLPGNIPPPVIPETMPDNRPENMPEQAMSDNRLEDMPEQAIPDNRPENMPEQAIPDNRPENTPESTENSRGSPEERPFGRREQNFGGGFPGRGGPGGMGNGATLQYTDDNPESYSVIFENAKTKISAEDQERLISSLKALCERENLEAVLDTEALLRYFVVHNFVVNGDSYTGNMVHNYYLYEHEGKLAMIPWDYNLAFGSFQGNNAVSAVNDPIDTPLSVTGDGSRPMIDWIFSSEHYTALYHQYCAEFLETADAVALINQAAALLDEYIQKDPTKFCTYDEYKTAVETLRIFCQLRKESLAGQLSGAIPSTDSGQNAHPDSLIDASEITLSAMGKMDMGGGRPGNMAGNMANVEHREDFFQPFGGNFPDRMNPEGSNPFALAERPKLRDSGQ